MELTIAQQAAMYGVSEERIRQQYSENAKGLRQMLEKSQRTGRKVNGYTAEQLAELVDKFEAKAQGIE